MVDGTILVLSFFFFFFSLFLMIPVLAQSSAK